MFARTLATRLVGVAAAMLLTTAGTAVAATAASASGADACPTSGPLRMITALSDIPQVCTQGRSNTYAHSDFASVSAEQVCDVARRDDDLQKPGVKNVSICFCGRKLFKLQGFPQEMACWVLYDE